MGKDGTKSMLKKLIIFCVLAVLLFAGYKYIHKQKGKDTETKVATTKVDNGNINVEISGDGVIEPFERYDITPLVYGNIEKCDYNETDSVKKDDVLYKFESVTVENNIKKLENNLEKLIINQNKLKENLEKTTVYAPHSGRLSGFSVKKDENVSTMTIAQVVDDSYYVAEVYYNKAQINNMYIGQKAIVVIPDVMSSDSGKISKISNTFIPQTNGVSLYSVEITINKKMSILEGTEAYAIVDGIESVGDGKIKSFERYPIVPEISGKVKEVYVSNNDYVKEGQKLFKIDEDTYRRSIRDGELDIQNAYISLAQTKKDLEDYSIKSPIDGVVLSKEYKAGDSINSNYKGTSLMVVANMSKVKFSMSIDELDIVKVKKGQNVEVTADALIGEVFEGKVTSVAEEGKSVNGVTNYTVEVTIDEPGQLKSGMNVNAVIIIENKEDVLVVPNSAVVREGIKYYVNVYKEDINETEKRYVQIGVSDSKNVEILEGLEKGEFVISSNLGGVYDIFDMDNMKKESDEHRKNMMDSMSGGGVR